MSKNEHLAPAIMNHSYDTVVVLTGGVRLNEQGLYVPSTPEDTDGNGMLAGEWRPMAAAALYLEGLADNYLVSGGISAKQLQRSGSGVPPAAEVYDEAMRKDIHEHGGDVSGVTSEFEADSPNTVHSLGTIQRMLAGRNLGRVGILTSDYHVPRTAALDELAYNTWNTHLPPIGVDFRVDYLSAERILLHSRPDMADRIVEAYRSPAAAQRRRNEAKGIRDIKSGKYRLDESIEGKAVSSTPQSPVRV